MYTIIEDDKVGRDENSRSPTSTPLAHLTPHTMIRKEGF
jgi:hypothetical protein